MNPQNRAIPGTASSTDNCTAEPMITSSDEVVLAGSITRTWKALDECGNSSTCDQIIKIVDSQAPMISCPIDVTIQCDETFTPETRGMATATDNCTSDPSITSNDVPAQTGCNGTGTITRTWKSAGFSWKHKYL